MRASRRAGAARAAEAVGLVGMIAVDPARSALLYQAGPGEAGAFDLATLEPVSLAGSMPVSAGAFAGFALAGR